MPRLEPEQLWWTADELAVSGLPMMPGTKRAVNMMATRGGWRTLPDAARKKPGRGGGWQYHWSVLPVEAQRALLARASDPETAPLDRGTAWATFDRLPDTVKAKARERLEAVCLVSTIHAAGNSHVASVSTVAKARNVSDRTLYNWLALVEGVDEPDWLAYLAPRHRLAKRDAPKATDTRPFMDHLKSQYLVLEPVTFKQCYRDAVAEAKAQGWKTLQERTAMRRLEAEVPRVTRVFMREGLRGLEKCFPPQIRDKTGMTAMEGVNADCHKIDVFVSWPDGTINRPQIVAFQDLYSGKILSWRVDNDPNKVMVMAAFGELVENWGIPRHCLFDNGHEFANKWMTAGTETRFRFKVREDDPLGVLPLLGIQVHWATPAHGQAKPVERTFRDWASDIAKDPRFHGAYVGNKPTAKPENYGSRAVPHETFLRVVAEGIAEHNARDGRLSPTAQGRSFDATFADSYANAPIQRATEEQRRLWLMGQHIGTLNRDNGSLKLYSNIYHSDWMSQRPGTKVIARFDPEDLHSGVFIYAVDGEFLGFAECQQAVGFFDVSGAKKLARRKADIRRAEKALAKAHRPMPIEEIAARKDARAPVLDVDREALEAKVVKPVFGASPARLPGRRPAPEPQIDPSVEASREAIILQMENRKPQSGLRDAQTSEDRFARARDILARSKAGDPVGAEEARWVREYQETAEYRASLRMFEAFGANGVS